jgi:hypothetical protein
VSLSDEQLSVAMKQAGANSISANGTTHSFRNYAELKHFLDDEVSFWQNTAAGLPEISQYFRQLKNLIDTAGQQSSIEQARGKMSEALAIIRGRGPTHLF